MPGILLHLLPASLYLGLSLHFWQRQRGSAPATAASGLQPWERVVLIAALAMQAVGLYNALFPGDAMHFGFAYALSLMLWLALAVYWIESFYARLDGLRALVLPVAALCALLPAIFPAEHTLANAGSPLFRAHFVMAMLAYSLFTLAALHAVLMAAAERRLHRGRLSRALAGLPPLLTMESILFRIILIGFVLLTLTLASGVLFSEALFGKPLSFNHKTLFALVSWLIFAGLLMGRHAYGWRGRKALRLTLAGFLTLLLAYVGSRFVVEVILGRSM
ncbi:MAG: cytochrome c biogenesis protein CcsA [Betaproteobacteria bacterium]|nr:cytochrome c biogenesis protein CcsA [Betaproteobacteria bacterium]